jgi:hypothetical protein
MTEPREHIDEVTVWLGYVIAHKRTQGLEPTEAELKYHNQGREVLAQYRERERLLRNMTRMGQVSD